ncbi:MAG TPA: molybdopterin-dependent oxidoreductase [Terriglobales bacterium]|nr:molybdopterin-dependent oxidoreductase [Terriglobales bacterium]
MKKRLVLCAAVVFLSVNAALLQCQQLTVQTETGKQTVLAKDEIASLPHTKVTAGSSDAPVTYEGVLLKAVLEKAGVEFGTTLRGKRMASCLLVEAADQYRVVIALPELDPDFTDKQIMLAFLRDGKPLDQKEGPYRIVIPDEKRMARWVRQVTTLKIVEVQ